MSAQPRIGRTPLDGFRHEALQAVGSTNSECLARARAGEPGGLWITAERQTGGRGRRGRAWSSDPGNLYASLLLINPGPVTDLGSLPLAVAVAVYRAIGGVLPMAAAAIEIKWPNDILIDRRKVCGILLEGERLPGGDYALVIGVGVNIATKPTDTPYPVTCLHDHGASVSAQELFAHLFAAMAEILHIWDQARGTARIVSLWTAAAGGIGQPITVSLPDRSVSGIFAGIDDKGMLRLERPSHAPLLIAAGDVFFE